MYKFLLVLLSAMGMAGIANAKQPIDMEQTEKKVLVAYFSATGNTARVAKRLADVVKGELYAITPAQPYTSATSTGTILIFCHFIGLIYSDVSTLTCRNTEDYE